MFDLVFNAEGGKFLRQVVNVHNVNVNSDYRENKNPNENDSTVISLDVESVY